MTCCANTDKWEWCGKHQAFLVHGVRQECHDVGEGVIVRAADGEGFVGAAFGFL